MDNETQKGIYLEILTQNYLTAFLNFAMKRTNNCNEAEELAQEIAYQIILAVNKSKQIENSNAFVWSIAHNT